jgi:hypothetical protein
MEHLFNKQGLKDSSLQETRLTAWVETTAACGGFFIVKGYAIVSRPT